MRKGPVIAVSAGAFVLLGGIGLTFTLFVTFVHALYLLGMCALSTGILMMAIQARRAPARKAVEYEPAECFHVFGKWSLTTTVTDPAYPTISRVEVQRRTCDLCGYTEQHRLGLKS